jgi:hypothetical protein
VDRLVWLRRIEALDPVADHQEIYRITVGYEFFEEYRASLALALFRTFAVPSISGLLAATGEFHHRTQKRYDDTGLLLGTLVEYGYDAPPARTALRSINRMHHRYNISNEEMLYVLSTFVYEPVRWIDRFGWRRMSPHERVAAFHFNVELGRRMGLRDLPADYDSFEKFNVAYEREHFRFAPSNVEIGDATLGLRMSWFPTWLRGLVRGAVLAPLDAPLLAAFGYRRPAWPVRALSLGGLRLVALRRRFARPPSVPVFHEKLIRTYPHGYTVDELGAGPPPADIDPALLAAPSVQDGVGGDREAGRADERGIGAEPGPQ